MMETNPPRSEGVRDFRPFLLSFLGTTSLLLAGMAGLNVVVDPYTSWNSPALPGVYDFTTSRVGKGEIFDKFRGDTVLVGNSRVMLGVRGDGKSANPPCNLGVSGASYGELQEILRCCLERDGIRRILFFVDFQTFREEYEFKESFAMSRFNPHKGKVDHAFDLVWNYHTSQDSFEKLALVFRGIAPEYTATACPIPERMTADESLPVRSEKILRNVTAEGQGGFRYAPETVEKLRALIRRCNAQSVELVLAINPTHATFLETVWHAGMWPEYQSWIRHLTRVVEEESQGQVALWDFNGFHKYTMEPLIQPNGAAARELRWFWEPSHFTCEIGDLMVQRINADSAADGEFGVRLRSSMVDGHLARMEADHDAWAARCQSEVRLVEQIAASGRIGFLKAEVQTADATGETVVR